jgi:hypothetical protein
VAGQPRPELLAKCVLLRRIGEAQALGFDGHARRRGAGGTPAVTGNDLVLRAWRTKQLRVGQHPAQHQRDDVLPGDRDTPVDLDGCFKHLAGSCVGIGLGLPRGSERGIAAGRPEGVERPGRVPHAASGGFHQYSSVGKQMGKRLIGADRAAELMTLPRVADRQLQCAAHQSELVGRNYRHRQRLQAFSPHLVEASDADGLAGRQREAHVAPGEIQPRTGRVLWQLVNVHRAAGVDRKGVCGVCRVESHRIATGLTETGQIGLQRNAVPS